MKLYESSNDTDTAAARRLLLGGKGRSYPPDPRGRSQAGKLKGIMMGATMPALEDFDDSTDAPLRK